MTIRHKNRTFLKNILNSNRNDGKCASIATETGPTVATKFSNSASSPCLTLKHESIVAPTLAFVNLQVPSFALKFLI